MKRRSRRSRGQKSQRRPSRQLFSYQAHVEQLEPRLVLSQLLGSATGDTLADRNSAERVVQLSWLSLPQPESAQESAPKSTWTEPRQLPGSTLQLLPLDDVYRIDPAIVAGDPNGTPPDSPIQRIDANTADSPFAGVGSLRTQIGSSNYVCTATPISPIHVISAAHCLDTDANGSINPTPSNVTFNVNMSGSSSTYQITANQLYVHPDWTGFNNPNANDDLAIIELSSELPADVPIYPLNETPFDDTVEAHFVGYGRSGTGVSGYTTNASYTIKRWGMNEIDYYYFDDEGSGAREVFQFDFDAPTSPGSLGNDVETTLGGGDSGGPSFIEDDFGNLVLFGINTFTTQFSYGSPAAPFFGSGGGGMVVSTYLDFINDILYGDVLEVTESGGSTTVTEGGAGDTLSLALASQPSHDVTVAFSGGGQLDFQPAQLVFTPSNWSTPQQLTVMAVDDTLAESAHVGWIGFTLSSADLGYDGAQLDDLAVKIADNDWALGTVPYVDLGTSDNVAWDQPRVAVEFFQDAEGTRSVGPGYTNTWLLDTGANTTIAFATSVAEMLSSLYPYETDGKFVEFGVAGPHEFDISVPYRFDFSGSNYERNTVLDARLISDPYNDISIFGPYGIVGMPAMQGRVTTFDFTVWTYVDIFGDLLMRVFFRDDVPAGNEELRYGISVDKRMTFSPDEQVVEGDAPPMWGDVPFMTMIPVHNGVAAGGNFIYDSGAQLSVMSTRIATEIGLDTNGDGQLDELDANFARYETVGGIGGTVDAPVFLFDEVHIPTEEGVDLVWTDLQWLVLDIADGLDGVMGFDLMTSGWIEAFAIDGQSGHIMQAQLDFRDWQTDGAGTIHLDLNSEFHQLIDPLGPGAQIIETGGSTTVSETGVDDTYQLVLTQPPTANVTVSLDVTVGSADDQITAVDAANPTHNYLVFTPANWDVPQTVLVSALDDNTPENFHRSSVRHVSSSADPDYQGVGMPRTTVNIIDNDYPGVMMIPTGGATEVVEGGVTDTYAVVLTYPPVSNVTITMDHVQGQVTAVSQTNPQNSFLVFTPQNWSVPQNVLVTAVDDGIAEGTHETYISHIITTEDLDYLEAFPMQELVVIRDPASAEVVDRHIFYNNSKFDSNNAAPGSLDDAAIATDKDALLPGNTATFANYTSFSLGINGIMIDVAGLAGIPTVNDFVLRVGNSDTPSSWQLAPVPASVSVRWGAGVGGSDRITLTWDDNAIAKKWLQVTLLSDEHGGTLGLADDDVFYFGNAIGETGDDPLRAIVNATDEIGARYHTTGFVPAAVHNVYDFNRDRVVNATDQIIARYNVSGFTALRLINVP